VRWQMCSRTVAATFLVVVVAACNSSAAPESSPEAENPPIAPQPDLKVAFFGDQGMTAEADEVLELVRQEGADMVIHSGDLDYENDPAAWDGMVTNVLGSDVPYFVVIGNHDESAWDGPKGYQRVAWERIADLPGVKCEGEYGEQSTCTYRGLWFLLSGVGVDDRSKTSHADFIQEECSAAPYLWKITNWHQNQTEMQVGDKNHQTGWRVYEESRSCGAIISTAHEHSYGRTRTLTNMVERTLDPTCPTADELCVGPGRTFVFHSGLGGHSIRQQERCFPAEFPYGCKGEWARIYTATQDATHGALFMTFHVDGDPAKAEGYFKNIDGQVVDSFTVTAVTG
jgi:predicted phosphodiesterase